MIKRILNRLWREISRVSLIADLLNKQRFAGITIHSSVNMDIRGRFNFSGGSIGVASNIIVASGATLSLGDDCYIGRYVELGPGGMIRIGSHTSLQDRCIVLGDVHIGAYCVLAPNIFISSGRHHFDSEPWSLIKDQDEIAASLPDLTPLELRQVVIEDDCWIGINAVVMRGVRIGKGSVVGANSIVTQDVAPYTVVAGVPARVLRKRLDFQPPRAIRWDCAEDIPYFYSGFQVSRNERHLNAHLQGLLANKKFQLALEAKPAGVLHIMARIVSPSTNVRLAFGGASYPLSEQFQELIFAVRGVSIHEFELLSDDAQMRLVVQAAWQE